MPAREDNDEIKRRQRELREEGVRMSFHATKRLLATENRLAAAIEQKQPATDEPNPFDEKIQLKLEQARPSFLSDGLGLRGPQNPLTNLSIDGADGRGRDMQVKRGEERRITETSESSGGSALVDVDSLGAATPLLIEATNVRKVEGKSLKAGAGITFNTATAGEIRINAGVVTPGDGVYVDSLGAAVPVLIDSSGALVDTVEGKSLRAGDNITLGTGVAGEILITSTASDTIDVNLVGAGGPQVTGYILVDPTDPNYLAGYSQHRSIDDANGSMEIVTGTDTINLSVRIKSGGFGIPIYSGTDQTDGIIIRTLISSDQSIFIQHDGTEQINLKGNYQAGNGIAISSATPPVIALFQTDAGDGQSLVKELSDLNGLQLYTINNLGEQGIAVQVVSDMLQFEAKAANVGGGEEVFTGDIDPDEGLQFRTIIAANDSGITVNTVGDTIEIGGAAGITQLVGDVTTPIDSTGNGVVATIALLAVSSAKMTAAGPGGTGGVYAYPDSITVDIAGRVTAITSGDGIPPGYEELEVQMKLEDDTCVTRTILVKIIV